MKKVLYLGTNKPEGEHILHYPVIRLIPRKAEEKEVLSCLTRLSFFSHVLFTSKNAVAIFFSLCTDLGVDPRKDLQRKCFSIGPITSRSLRSFALEPIGEASCFTQEGLVEELNKLDLIGSHILYPRSSRARPFLQEELQKRGGIVKALDLYDTEYQRPLPIPDLSQVEEIVFTSPSTVEAFFCIFTVIPEEIHISCQGPITKAALARRAMR